MKHPFILMSACLVFFVSACSSSPKEISTQETFPVTNPVLIDTVFTTDYVAEIHSLQNVELRARINGYLDRVHVEEGASVQQGQLLFSISNKEYRERLAKATALLKSAVAEARSAELEVQNVKSLLAKNVVSQTELELAQSKLEALNAKIEEARSEESSAALELSYTEIRAPFTGIINRIPNKTGSLIEGGTLLTTISNNQSVLAYFKVSEKEYLQLVSQKKSENTPVELILADGSVHAAPGVIENIDGEFDKSTGTIAFKARFKNTQQVLKHGSSGKVRVRKALKDAILIPQKSTFEIQENTCVFVVDKDNVVRLRTVVPKLRIPNLYVLESGLSTGYRIVYEGVQRVKDGDKIAIEVVSKDEMLAQLAE